MRKSLQRTQTRKCLYLSFTRQKREIFLSFSIVVLRSILSFFVCFSSTLKNSSSLLSLSLQPALLPASFFFFFFLSFSSSRCLLFSTFLDIARRHGDPSSRGSRRRRRSSEEIPTERSTLCEKVERDRGREGGRS